MELNVHNTLRGVDSQDDNLTSYTLTYFYWSAVDLHVLRWPQMVKGFTNNDIESTLVCVLGESRRILNCQPIYWQDESYTDCQFACNHTTIPKLLVFP